MVSLPARFAFAQGVTWISRAGKQVAGHLEPDRLSAMRAFFEPDNHFLDPMFAEWIQSHSDCLIASHSFSWNRSTVSKPAA